MPEHTAENTNWQKSVCGVVLHNDNVLLARHTYGPGKGRLILPGGYLNRCDGRDESPEDALVREVMEECGVLVQPRRLIGVRFNQKDWYAAFWADYLSGQARSDNDENSEVLWLPTQEALAHPEVPQLSQRLIAAALKARSSGLGLGYTPYEGTLAGGPYALYTIK